MNPPALDFRNVNALWGSVVAETLSRLGADQAVISPGSRSTALAFAFARHPGFEAVSVLDERSAAFFALGLAKQRRQPVVLVCTSGTAAANYFPAIIEAQEAGVPLLVITADRPPEMRACASGQTIDQQKLYGAHVNFFHELAVPEASAAMLRYLRQTIAHAFERVLRPFAGPVHLNAPFRDPLPPVSDGGAVEEFGGKINWERFFGHLAHPAEAIVFSAPPVFSSAVHGVIVAGPVPAGDPAAYAAGVGEVARRLRWPVLADGLSIARNHADAVPNLVTTYDAVLRAAGGTDGLRPELVLCLGEWPTSKVLRGWLESSGAPTYLVTERPDNRDSLHGSTRHIPIALAVFAAGLPQAADPNGYQRLWEGYEARAREALDKRLASENELVEPKAAWLLGRHLPEGTPVSVANSMPVRDMEYVWPANNRRLRPHFNRGANGIDGTLSTAMGVAHGGAPAVLLAGDLALLHDTNGFLLAPKLRGSLSIVLINNSGGGIFEHLPVAEFGPIFEEFFATPQVVDFARLCAAYGVEHIAVRDWDHFTDLISSLPASGIRVLELKTNRKSDAGWRKRLFAEIARAATG
jgi:2-succinyl-5-enolpyruvyl-6-hydroxy-3-cyclohexene-1-carboxylate synthase